jgi:hypothetical protein
MSVWASTGTSFSAPVNFTSGGSAPFDSGNQTFVGDFTGDGLDDFLVWSPDNGVSFGSMSVWASTGTSFSAPVNFTAGGSAPFDNGNPVFVGGFAD